MARPNPEDFSKNERPNKYRVLFYVRGEVSLTIEAENPQDASRKAKDMIVDDDFGLELDEVTSAEVAYISKEPTMYRVLRNGKPMQVSRLQEGDLPRDPDHRGF